MSVCFVSLFAAIKKNGLMYSYLTKSCGVHSSSSNTLEESNNICFMYVAFPRQNHFPLYYVYAENKFSAWTKHF
jgi:hypothetical protein